MRVRWNSIGGNILRESEFMRKIELSQIKKQIEVLTTFLPDLILKLPKQEFDEVHHFVGVLLFADVSGFTPLCEKYNKTGKGGIYRLTATLNAYIGAIVEVIYFCGGDVLKFSGDAFLAMWKSGPEQRLYRVIHEVIVCALFIQQTLGHFETEVNVLLKVKLAISCGNLTFSVIGDEENKHYIILGPAINDVKAAEHASVSGDVVVAPTAWGHVAEESYDVTYTDSGNVKVWRCLYKPNERSKKEEYDQKFIMVQQLCSKHIHHRETLHLNKMVYDNLVDSKITERFVRSLPQRATLKLATQKWYTKDMNPFIIKPVQQQVEEKQPLEYLTEMREVTIQFINIVPTTYDVAKLVAMLNNAYQVVCKIVCKLLGVVNKVSLFDKDAMMLVLFGLRGIRHEIESQNSLKSAYQIRKDVLKLEYVKSVSVGVTNGLVYCGVVGHPLRREYTVIGGSVNKAARLMCAFQDKVTCDYKTYKNSKLSSYYFQMQPAIKLKGIEDAGHIFEYNEDFESILHCEKSDLPLIGRESELRYIDNIIFRSDEMGYKGMCYYGKQKVGQTRLLHAAYKKYQSNGLPVAAVQLCSGSVRPYFCVSHLYKQLYDSKAKIDSGEEDAIKYLPADLWNYNDVLQQSKSQTILSKKQKILNIFKSICSSTPSGVTILFIDNVQYVDNASMEVITEVLKEDSVRLFVTGHFEEDHWKTRWALFKSNCIKLEEISPMRPDEIPSLVCQLLRIRGVPKKLVSLLMRTCEGCPGWIQTCLLRLVNNGCLEIKFINVDDVDNDRYVFPSPELLSNKYTIEEREAESTQKTLLSVAELLDKFKNQTEELTLAAISLDLFDSFTPYQQLVIKTGAVLGDIFSRSLLIVILKYPNEQVFANAIMNLYEEEVFDCGTKYISTGGQLANTLNCYCYMQEEDFSQDRRKSIKDLPTYALCKLMHFKNKSLRSVAYELLPANQRKELHLRITNVLENQNNMCPNCLRDDSVAIIKMKTFKQVMQFCNNKNVSYEEPASSDSDLADYNEVNIKDVIRESIQQDDDHGDEEKSYNISGSSKFKRKVWDPTTCFCLEIMTKVYTDLIFHSDKAGQLGKKIFYLMQYGAILMTMHEFKDAIPALTEASELCMTDAKCKNSFITEEFRRLHIGRIHFLLSEVYFRLGDIGTAKVHIVISLRQYNVPIMSLKYKIPHLLLKRPTMFTKVRKPKFIYNRGVRSLMNSDFGHCLNLLSNIFATEGRWSLAKMASKRSLYLLTMGNPNVPILCDSYSTAIELHSFCGDPHTCEILDRSVSRDILKSFTGNLIVELYSICKLITVVFLFRITHGQLSKAIRIGYRAMDLNMTIQASYVQLQVIPVLASALLLANRIENAVYAIRVLYNIGRNLEEFALLDYYGFCLELNIETSFLLEPIEVCEKYAERHFERKVDRDNFTDSERKLIILLHLYYLRNNRWSDALKWKTMIRIDNCESTSIFAMFNLMKFTESLLITFVWNKASNKTFLDLEEKRLLVYLKQCQAAAKRWRAFMPRYLHYLAYYNQIVSKLKLSSNLLKRALKIAKEQENILEACWINQSIITWDGGLNFGNDAKDINWKLAHTYTEQEWSQILYALPCTIYS